MSSCELHTHKYNYNLLCMLIHYLIGWNTWETQKFQRWTTTTTTTHYSCLLSSIWMLPKSTLSFYSEMSNLTVELSVHSLVPIGNVYYIINSAKSELATIYKFRLKCDKHWKVPNSQWFWCLFVCVYMLEPIKLDSKGN